MQRGQDIPGSGGLGPGLAGEKISVNDRNVSVIRQIGEGGFSFAYLVKDLSSENSQSEYNSSPKNQSPQLGHFLNKDPRCLVLKITSIHNRQQRDIAEKEAKLLSRLSHPSIVRLVDSCYRTVSFSGSNNSNMLSGLVGGPSMSISSNSSINSSGARAQHLILMEYCEGGTAYEVCNNMKNNNKRFNLPSLIIAFGQICNAVSYLHAQRPPIVHRDLKPVNFLVQNGTYKLCDFGSAVFGHVDLRTASARREAEEVIQKTTTQMFRAPEMIDLFMTKKLTQSTDVWALGCCLYSLAFFQNCFEEGSNLAILSRNYKIPENNSYGDSLCELIDRMLTIDYKERADMTEIILCLSAIYSDKPLPPRKRVTKLTKGESIKRKEETKERVGAFRTDGQGIRDSIVETKKPVEAKKLNPNSAAARRRNAAKQSAAENLSLSAVDKNDSSTTPVTQKGFVNFGSSTDTFHLNSSNTLGTSEKKGSSSDDVFFNKEKQNNTQDFGNYISYDGPKSLLQENNVFAPFEHHDDWNMNTDKRDGSKTLSNAFGSNQFPLETPTSGLNVTPTRRRLDFDSKQKITSPLGDATFSDFNRLGLDEQKDRGRSKSQPHTNRDTLEKKRGLKGFKNLFRKNEQKI